MRFGSQRVALSNSRGLFYLYTDHLGSTNQIMHGTDYWYSTEWYYPFGGVRSTGGNHDSPTDYEFTGQKKDSTGLMYYGARYYAPGLARFIQPDTIVPDPSNPQSLNRYSYVLNNPLGNVDPTGHCTGPANDPNNPDAGCWTVLNRIVGRYRNIRIDSVDWTENQLDILEEALQRILQRFNNSIPAFESAFGTVTFSHANPILNDFFGAPAFSLPGLVEVLEDLQRSISSA